MHDAGHHRRPAGIFALITRGVPPRIAVVGVTSLIGEAVLDELRARKFQYMTLHALDDERNIGRPVASEDEETGKSLQVNPVAGFDFSGVDLVIFCGRGALAEQHAEAAAAHAWVIDCSAAFRGRSDVPLIGRRLARTDRLAGQRQRGAGDGAGAVARPGGIGTRGGGDLPGRLGQRARRHG